MRIGILEAETLPEKVITKFGSYGDMFIHLFTELNTGFTFRKYAVDQNNFPISKHECDAWLVTGSRFNAYDNEPWQIALKEFIRNTVANEIKIAGICFGHQIIADALGGKVEKSEKGWGIGSSHFQIVSKPEWMQTSLKEFDILVSHQDQVITLPPNASLFATNSFCENGGYFIDNSVFCLQGHPEFSPAYLSFLIQKRAAIFGEALTRTALQSITQQNALRSPANFLCEFFK